jgi:hypothetical protein
MNDTISKQGDVLSNNFQEIIRRHPIRVGDTNKATNLKNMLNSIALMFSFTFLKQRDQLLFQSQQDNDIYFDLVKMELQDFDNILNFLAENNFIQLIVDMPNILQDDSIFEDQLDIKTSLFIEKLKDVCFRKLKALSNGKPKGFGQVLDRILSVLEEGVDSNQNKKTFQEDVITYMIDILIMYLLGDLINSLMFNETKKIPSNIKILHWFDEVTKIFEDNDMKTLEAQQRDGMDSVGIENGLLPTIPKIEDIKANDDLIVEHQELNVNQMLVKLSIGSLLSYLIYKIIKKQ